MVGLDNPIHLAFLLVILLLIFGAKRLPEIGRSLGSGLRGFKESINGDGSTHSHEALAAASVEPAHRAVLENEQPAAESIDSRRAA